MKTTHTLLAFIFILCVWFLSYQIMGKSFFDNLLIYCFSLFLYGIIIGIICQRMVFSAYFGMVLGQYFCALSFEKSNPLIGVGLIYFALFSMLTIFGNAIGAAMRDRS